MLQDWYDVFPQFHLIHDEVLQKNSVQVCQEALEIGGWTMEDTDRLPFTLLIPGLEVSYRRHVAAVTDMAVSVFHDYGGAYGSYGKYTLDFDLLVAGALLHDVGKLMEYRRDENGCYVKSDIGQKLRHPFSGAGLAIKHGLPWDIAHIIATHAGEGNGGYRTPESVLIYHIDQMNFMSIRAFRGLI